MSRTGDRLGLGTKIVLVCRIWLCFLAILIELRVRPLPHVITRLGIPSRRTREPVAPARLGRIVQRTLRAPGWQARCLFSSLVLYRLLRLQGERCEVVIGLPREPKDKDAHAWVELDGIDVGPPPGGRHHQELARYS
jgi:hypothetical protein